MWLQLRLVVVDRAVVILAGRRLQLLMIATLLTLVMRAK